MISTLKLFAAILPIFLAIDLLWLGVIMAKFYDSELGSLARRSGTALDPHWPSALLVYIIIPLGILLFALPKAGESHLMAAVWGGVYGLFLYGVYDLTNMATLSNWSVRLATVDMIWGFVLCGSVCLIASYIAPLLK